MWIARISLGARDAGARFRALHRRFPSKIRHGRIAGLTMAARRLERRCKTIRKETEEAGRVSRFFLSRATGPGNQPIDRFTRTRVVDPRENFAVSIVGSPCDRTNGSLCEAKKKTVKRTSSIAFARVFATQRVPAFEGSHCSVLRHKRMSCG